MGYKEEKLYLDRKSEQNEAINFAIEHVKKRHKRKIKNAYKKIEKIGCCHHFYDTYTEEMDDSV